MQERRGRRRPGGEPPRPLGDVPCPPRTLADLDREVLHRCLELAPDLAMVAFAGTLARQTGLRYPLRSPSALRPLFMGRQRLSFLGHTVSWPQVSKYVRPEFFPIRDERMFLTMVQVALAIQAQEGLPTLSLGSQEGLPMLSLGSPVPSAGS